MQVAWRRQVTTPARPVSAALRRPPANCRSLAVQVPRTNRLRGLPTDRDLRATQRAIAEQEIAKGGGPVMSPDTFIAELAQRAGLSMDDLT